MYTSCEKIVVVYEICNLIGKIGSFQMLDHINLKYILYLKSKDRNKILKRLLSLFYLFQLVAKERKIELRKLTKGLTKNKDPGFDNSLFSATEYYVENGTYHVYK